MQFLVDAQVPPAIADILRRRGHDAEHITDIGPGDASDSDLDAHALEHGDIVITKDENFIDLAVPRPTAPTIVWMRVGNQRLREMLAWFEARVPAIEGAVGNGVEDVGRLRVVAPSTGDRGNYPAEGVRVVLM